MQFSLLPRRATLAGMTFAGFALTGCGALDANDPTTLRVENVQNNVGAAAAVATVRADVKLAHRVSLRLSGALTDEFSVYADNDEFLAGMSVALNTRDRSWWSVYDAGSTPIRDVYSRWQDVYRDVTVFLPTVSTAAAEGDRAAFRSEVLSWRGYALINLGEQLCPGWPLLHLTVSGESIIPAFDSDPQTPDSAFVHALVDFDSALAYAGDSVYLTQLAQLGRARALLGLGRFAEAATAASAVQTEFTDNLMMKELASYFRDNQWPTNDVEGGTGLPYLSANDPRLPLTEEFGGFFFIPSKYYSDPMPSGIASGIEARLIEAEAQLQPASNPSGPWLQTLNSLRASAGLSDTTDPGNAEDRVNLLFYERAFTLFGTAHRLGDLRRLLTRYGRDAAAIYPSQGTDMLIGIPYGDLTNLPFNGKFDHLLNPKITGCTDAPPEVP